MASGPLMASPPTQPQSQKVVVSLQRGSKNVESPFSKPFAYQLGVHVFTLQTCSVQLGHGVPKQPQDWVRPQQFRQPPPSKVGLSLQRGVKNSTPTFSSIFARHAGLLASLSCSGSLEVRHGVLKQPQDDTKSLTECPIQDPISAPGEPS